MIKNIYRKLQTLLVPRRIKSNFIKISSENRKILADKVNEIYIPTISDSISKDRILIEVEEHVENRLDVDRTRVIPWLDKNIPLKNLEILEIGCGTGSSTITLAEQGAKVLGIDIHKQSLEIAVIRSKLYDLNIEFMECSSVNITNLNRKFDAIMLYATLEHLTLEERLLTLKNCSKVLNSGGYLVVIEAPNRLWSFDSHTSELPFFQWLPDDLAYRYSKFSPKKSFSTNYQDTNYDNLLGFLRRGRGVSFHEFELVFGDLSKLNIISRLNRLVFTSSFTNTFLIKPMYKLFLRNHKKVPKAFYDEYLDFIIKI